MGGKQTIETRGAPAAIGPYSQATRSGDHLYVSGQIPLDPGSGEIVGGDAEAQMGQVLKNLGEVLRAGGCGPEDVVKTTLYLKDMGDFPKVNAVYAQYFKKPFPARSTVEVAGLPRDVLVELEAIACRP